MLPWQWKCAAQSMLILWYTMELVWLHTIWPSCLPDEWWHCSDSLMRLRTNSRRSSGHSAKQHLLMACGCSFAAVVTQCDTLTCVFKSIVSRPGLISFEVFSVPVAAHAGNMLSLPSGTVSSVQHWWQHLQSWCLLHFNMCLFYVSLFVCTSVQYIFQTSRLFGICQYLGLCVWCKIKRALSPLMKLWNRTVRKYPVICRRNHNFYATTVRHHGTRSCDVNTNMWRLVHNFKIFNAKGQ